MGIVWRSHAVTASGKKATNALSGKPEATWDVDVHSIPHLFLAFLKLGATSFGGPFLALLLGTDILWVVLLGTIISIAVL